MRSSSWRIHVLLLFTIHYLGLSIAAWNATDDEAPTRIELRKLQRIIVIGGTGTPPDDAYPLQKCQGDCDRDEDCAYGLRCFQRNPYTLVPGCIGGKSDSSYSDYCVDPDDIASDEATATTTRSSNNIFSSSSAYTYSSKSKGFRLKLYWENGYYWQESDRELKFCMMYNYRANHCWYGLRRQVCDLDKIYISECSDDPRQTFSFEYLPGNRKEVLIQIGAGLHNTCLERSGRDIVLAWCDANSPLQRWYSPNGDFDSYRFEISQYDYSSQCVTQAHHPKEGEVVELHSCRGSRREQTSFWNKY